MDKINEKDNACAFDLPNNQAPHPYNEIFYGNQHVPKPTNAAAKITNHDEVMNAVLHGK